MVAAGGTSEYDEDTSVTYTCDWRTTMRFVSGQWQPSNVRREFEVVCGSGGEWLYPEKTCQAFCMLNRTLLPDGIVPDRDASVVRVLEGESVT